MQTYTNKALFLDRDGVINHDPGDYTTSLEDFVILPNVLETLKKGGMRTKTGMMLGLGETKDEVVQTMKDLVNVGCDVLTLGQYLQPTKKHLAVQRFVHPDEFAELREIGYEIGFDYVESGPLVRSSYHSEKHVIKGWGKNKWLSEKSL